MAPQPPLSHDEDDLLGHYRRLRKHHRDFKLEVYGTFKAGRRQVQFRPTPYITVQVDELEAVFDAVD